MIMDCFDSPLHRKDHIYSDSLSEKNLPVNQLMEWSFSRLEACPYRDHSCHNRYSCYENSLLPIVHIDLLPLFFFVAFDKKKTSQTGLTGHSD